MTTVRKMKSNTPGFFEDYLYWLISLVSRTDNKTSNYIALFNTLQDTEFYWTIELDSNRAHDAVRLRNLYKEQTGNTLSQEELDKPVSLLEVLVAMAIRCEDDIMHETALGDRTNVWFWSMIKNAGLQTMDDDNFDLGFVEQKCRDILERNYATNGYGGLFYTNDERCHRNFKRIDLWEQLSHWLNWAYPDI